MQQKFNEFYHQVKTNHDDFVWILFEKPCGFSFLFPFLKNASTNVLYDHIENLWRDKIVYIWFNHSIQNNQPLYKGESIKLRDWIRTYNLRNIQTDTSLPLVYRVFFDVIDQNNINHSCTHHT